MTAKNKRNRNDLIDVADYKQSAYVSKLLEGVVFPGMGFLRLIPIETLYHL